MARVHNGIKAGEEKTKKENTKQSDPAPTFSISRKLRRGIYSYCPKDFIENTILVNKFLFWYHCIDFN